jgi:hypothetical protein
MSLSHDGDIDQLCRRAGCRQDGPMISDADILSLGHALRAGPGSTSFETDLHALASWALTARIDSTLVELVLAGKLLVLRQADGDWGFRLTPADAAPGGTASGGRP